MLLVVRREATLLAVAVQFLTRLPTPRLHDFSNEWLAQSARYFPAVGVLVGALSCVVWWLAGRVLPNDVAVGLMMVCSLLVTGAFHEDGLCDACDGFGGGDGKTRILEIMRDSRVGAYGAIGIAMALGLKWTTLTALPRAGLPLIAIAAHMVSRWCAIGLIWRLEYVREDAAKARPFAGGVSALQWLTSGLIGVAAFALTAGVWCLGSAASLRYWVPDGWALCAGAAASAGVAWAAARYFRARLGGYTGDCLGAVQQLGELAYLLTSAAVCAGDPVG